MASLVRGIARLVGLAGTAAAAEAEEATEEALHAYLRDEDDEQESDVDSDDDVGGLVQEQRDRSLFPPDEFPFEMPEVINTVSGTCRPRVPAAFTFPWGSTVSPFH